METVTDKNKTSNGRAQSEERSTLGLKSEKAGFDWQGFAISATLTMVNGALFALGGMAAKSAASRLRPKPDSQNFLVDGSGNKKQFVGHA